jgi:cytochrome bd-type quinol oxidase subunit 1
MEPPIKATASPFAQTRFSHKQHAHFSEGSIAIVGIAALERALCTWEQPVSVTGFRP